MGILVADHLCAPIDHLPEQGELVRTERISLEPGGCAANTAIALKKLGYPVAIVGCVGDDVMGRYLRDALTERGVDTSHVAVRPDFATSSTLVVNVAGQDRRFVHAIGANAALRAADVPGDLLRSARLLYVGGYLVLPGLDPEELAGLLARARAHGVITVLDVVSGPGSDPGQALQPVLPHTDHFLPNEDEARAITAESDPLEQAEALRDMGAHTVVVTGGARGAWLVSSDARLWVAPLDVEFVDGTGAGDAFTAGYVTGLLEGLQARDRLRLGAVLGANCVTRVGATAGALDRPAAAEWLRRAPPAVETIP